MSLSVLQPNMIRAQLVQAMVTGEFSGQDRLPPESALSEMLGISRTQLRDVLASLEREGFITRRHGVGTVINRHVLRVAPRMDIELEFMDIIRQSGYEPAVALVSVAEDQADAGVAGHLSIPEGSAVLRIEKVCTADGRPAIYCEDILPRAMLKQQVPAEAMNRPIFEVLQQYCGTSAYLDLTELHAVVADEALAAQLRLAVGTPVLRLDEVDYDIEGKPVFYSRQFFVEGLIRFTILHKKL